MEILIPKKEREKRQEIGELFDRLDVVIPRHNNRPLSNFDLPRFCVDLTAEDPKVGKELAGTLGRIFRLEQEGGNNLNVNIENQGKDNIFVLKTDEDVRVAFRYGFNNKLSRAVREYGGLLGDFSLEEGKKIFNNSLEGVALYLEKQRELWVDSLLKAKEEHLEKYRDETGGELDDICRWLSRSATGALFGGLPTIEGDRKTFALYVIRDMSVPFALDLDRNYEYGMGSDRYKDSEYLVKPLNRVGGTYKATFDTFDVTVSKVPSGNRLGTLENDLEVDFCKFLGDEHRATEYGNTPAVTLLWADPEVVYPVFAKR